LFIHAKQDHLWVRATPAIVILFAGTKNFCPGTRMARSYNTEYWNLGYHNGEISTLSCSFFSSSRSAAACSNPRFFAALN